MAESTENDENNNPNQGDNDQRQPQGGDQKPTKNRRNRNNNNNKRRRNRKNKKNREKVLSIKYKKPDWDGMIDGLDGHAFQHPDEHPPNTQYQDTCKSIIKYVTLEYDHGTDIAYLVENLEDASLDEPIDLESGATATQTKIWEYDVKLYCERRHNYRENKRKLFTTIWAHCSPTLKTELKTYNDWESLRLSHNPIELLHRLKSISYRFSTQDYVYSSVYKAQQLFFTYQQGSQETNDDYYKNFKQIIEVMKQYGVSVCADKTLVYHEMRNDNHLETNDCYDFQEFDDDDKSLAPRPPVPGDAIYDKYIPVVQSKAWAYAFLAGADPKRFGTILTDLHNDYMKNHNNYPDSLTGAYHYLVNLKTSSISTSNPSIAKHDSSDDDNDENGLSFTNIANVICYKCGNKGHYANSPKCPLAGVSRPPALSSNTATSSAPTTDTQDAIGLLCAAAQEEPDSLGWSWNTIGQIEEDSSILTSNLHPTTTQQIVLAQGGTVDPNWILLDSQSTVDLFANPNLLKDIHHTNGPRLRCFCNSGVQFSTLKGTLPGYGTVWHNPHSLANVLSLSRVSQHYRVTFDSSAEQAFVVHRPDGTVTKFIQHDNGLYYHDVRWNRTNQDGTLLVQTVQSNKLRFTPRQLKQANLARRVYGMIGHPSPRDFLTMVQSNQLQNCPISVDDVKLAIQVYGPDISSLKGKVTRAGTHHVPSTSIIPLPTKLLTLYKDVTLCIDIFYLDKLVVLATVSRNLLFITTDFIDNRKIHDTVYPRLVQVQKMYKARGFKITSIHADGEFSPLYDDLLALKILLNTASADEHVPEIERLIRVIKERIRCIYASLPFTFIPTIMKKQLFRHIITWLNMFPRKGSISDNLSPRIIVTGTTLNFKHHCRVPFGTYCQIHDEPSPSNTPTPRTSGAIALNAQGNQQGGYHFMVLATGKLVTRRSWTELPMPQEVIDRVDALGKQSLGLRPNAKKLPQEFRFRRRDKSIIPDHPITNPINSHPLDLDLDVVGAVDEVDDATDNHTLVSNDDDADSDVSCSDDDNSLNSDDSHSDGMEDTDHDNSNPTLGAHTDELGAHHDDITDLQDSVLNQPIALPASRYDNTTTVETYDDNATIKNKEEEKIDTITEVTEEKVQLDNVATTNESKSAEIDEGNMIQPGTVTGYPLRRIGRTNYHHLLLHNGQEIILHLDGDVEPLPPTNLFDFHHKYGYAAHIMVQQMSAKKGLKLFGERAAAAIVKECKQLHDKQVFIPISFDKLTSAQRIRALRAITLIAEKRSGDIKGRTVADGRSQRDYTDPGDAASPTVSIEALLLSCVIDALEERDVATCDISGAFLQADIDDVVHVKFEGPMVDLMIRTDPLYKRFVKVFPSGKKVLMVQLKKAMYGCIKAARLFYENLKKTLLNMGFVLNPLINVWQIGK